MTEPIFIPHQEFKTGLPRGRFRVIVNPERAQKYIKHKLMVIALALPMIGIGVALALSGYPWAGAPLVLIGILLPRYIKKQAAQILLYLAQNDAKTYQEAIEYEILEVKMADQ
jgi:predicted transcriptional regulator of viral defense system